MRSASMAGFDCAHRPRVRREEASRCVVQGGTTYVPKLQRTDSLRRWRHV